MLDFDQLSYVLVTHVLHDRTAIGTGDGFGMQSTRPRASGGRRRTDTEMGRQRGSERVIVRSLALC